MKRYDMCHAKMVECYDGDYVLFDESERLAMREANSNAVLGDGPTVDQLKCCGNCVSRDCMDNGNDFNEYCVKLKHMASWNYCNEWEWDGLKRYDRTDGVIVPD